MYGEDIKWHWVFTDTYTYAYTDCRLRDSGRKVRIEVFNDGCIVVDKEVVGVNRRVFDNLASIRIVEPPPYADLYAELIDKYG